ncbi:hypothetical protein WJX79_005030 [Trebouxia sp. C0005]
MMPRACSGMLARTLHCRLYSTDAAVLEIEDSLRVASLVHSFRNDGHLAAALDPLRRVKQGPWLTESRKATTWNNNKLGNLVHDLPLDASHPLESSKLASKLGLLLPTTDDRQFCVGDVLDPGTPHRTWTLPAIVKRMQAAYCGTLTAELNHLATSEKKQWLVQRMENRQKATRQEQLAILRRLVDTDAFERFLAAKFPASKRFGVEGCEAVLVGLETLVARCAQHGVCRIELGMPHRGRLNVLCNILKKPPGALYGEMEGGQSEFHVGDVKYHLGQSASLDFAAEEGGKASGQVRVSIAPNPSHLEFIGPVVLGMVRAEQTRLQDTAKQRVMGLLIHGDAAFAGLGVVAETLQLADTPGFSTGGTIHLIINNQVGFTTAPADARSSPHCTDIAKTIGAPILHVNADDPEAVVEACRIAADWRAEFKQDVVVDIVGYRRYGHNELDDPTITLPLSYQAVMDHPPVLQLYASKLDEQAVLKSSQVKALQDVAAQQYEQEFEAFQSGKYKESAQNWLHSSWQGDALQAVGQAAVWGSQEPTGLPLPTLAWLGNAICNLPMHFTPHQHTQKLLQKRRQMCKDDSSRVDFAMAEALAFGTLALRRGVRPAGVTPSDFFSMDPSLGLNRGHYAVRLSGQDSERGTFNQRHAALYDQVTGERLVKLNCMVEGQQEPVEIWNSPLSEAAVLGFEYGYSLGCAGTSLVVWEAQFGDFANNAQVIIDQFIAAGEERWGQQSGLVLLLPHGYDGAGPDHSSARLERFLSLCNDDADHLPGHSPSQRRQMSATFTALAKDHGGRLNRQQVMALLKAVGGQGEGAGEGEAEVNGELAESLWTEMGLAPDAHITQDVWQKVMVQHMRRHAERLANMFVVNATTPAQMFHALRRQLNRPFQKPLVLLTPKFLLHHRPATSALHDFTTGTFFNRVIDDGKASDNTRQAQTESGESWLLPAHETRRVILCSGQIYYTLSRARKSRQIRDVILVRLEQIAPFPHDLVTQVVMQYSNAQVVWCQEEPKNMGAWRYIKPRMDTAMRELVKSQEGSIPPPRIRYVGRPAAASPATASLAIHRQETDEIVNTALSDTLVLTGEEEFVRFDS